MNFKKILNLIVAALFTAIICISTIVIRIPLPATGGYVNLGDCFVLISGMYLGLGYGALAAGLGSAAADLLSGYAQYAPASFVIKVLMAVTVYYVYKAFKGKHSLISRTVSTVVAEVIMVIGYFGYEALILQYGMGAFASVVPDILQGAVAVCAAIAVSTAFNIAKNKASHFNFQ